MNFSRREGSFVANINGGLLSVTRLLAPEGWGKGGDQFINCGSEPLFTIPVGQMPWFVRHGDGLYAQNAHDVLTPLYRGDDASQLLSCVDGLLTIIERKRSRRHKLCGYVAATIVAGVLFAASVTAYNLFQHSGIGKTANVNNQPADLSLRKYANDIPAMPALPPDNKNSGRTDLLVQQSPSAAPADGWDLPLNVREGLPEKLRNAASRELFTVPLSNGHSRTIYVFADPACPNCQRMERYFETAAGTVNVVIFPVTIEGRESSLKALTPVMALPEAERPAAWKQLFAADAGISVPGATQAAPAVTDETKAETARGAIGVNEVAFRAYRLPGTPWTISDDGRYVPQSVLSSPTALAAFLNGDNHGQ